MAETLKNLEGQPESAPLAHEELIERFAAEVRDKIGVVFHGSNSTPAQRAIVRKQAEAFLIELFADALSAPPAQPHPSKVREHIQSEISAAQENHVKAETAIGRQYYSGYAAGCARCLELLAAQPHPSQATTHLKAALSYIDKALEGQASDWVNLAVISARIEDALALMEPHPETPQGVGYGIPSALASYEAGYRVGRASQPPPEALIALLQRQLDAADRALGFPHPDGLGRVEMIEMLKAQTEALRALSQQWRREARELEHESRTATRQREVSMLSLAGAYRCAANELDALIVPKEPRTERTSS